MAPSPKTIERALAALKESGYDIRTDEERAHDAQVAKQLEWRRQQDRERKARARRWHTIYKLYAADDELLYIGICANGPARLADHARSKAWFREVVRAEFEHIQGRPAAEDRERDLIAEHRPRWNVAGKDRAYGRLVGHGWEETSQ